ncbi:COP9 signalosome complex subunit 9 [Copidosoma floridanum]|uniref:COP9 signalosome complex subunit 9 n=1 Tax=Copidosoma floridanum TaxID=29053 RepID=UPI0006C9D855|nr:COP9 signalosome complex subunit 9 [Copidosoma floridanum]
MKPTPLVADEMFPEGAGRFMSFEMISDNMEEMAGGSNSIMIDIGTDEKAVHADFFNKFEDLFDDDDLE